MIKSTSDKTLQKVRMEKIIFKISTFLVLVGSSSMAFAVQINEVIIEGFYFGMPKSYVKTLKNCNSTNSESNLIWCYSKEGNLFQNNWGLKLEGTAAGLHFNDNNDVYKIVIENDVHERDSDIGLDIGRNKYNFINEIRKVFGQEDAKVDFGEITSWCYGQCTENHQAQSDVGRLKPSNNINGSLIATYSPTFKHRHYYQLAFFEGVDSSDKRDPKPKPVTTPIVSPTYSVGDRVYVLFSNGKRCNASIIVAGKDQSKVEYNEYCKINFIGYKSDGEEEWVPNNALESR